MAPGVDTTGRRVALSDEGDRSSPKTAEACGKEGIRYPENTPEGCRYTIHTPPVF